MATLRIALIVIFLIAAIAVTVIVLLQEGKSAGLGSLNGSGNGDTYWDKNKKHSLEGKFERWTKMTAGILVLAAFILMFISAPSSVKNDAVIETPGITNESGDTNVEAEGATTEPSATETTEPSATPAE